MPPAVMALVDRTLPYRVYPLDGGEYVVKWPYRGGVVPGREFRIEPGGWDHEHCDGCNRSINVGRTFWQTARGSVYWLCPYCYRRTRQLSQT